MSFDKIFDLTAGVYFYFYNNGGGVSISYRVPEFRFFKNCLSLSYPSIHSFIY